MGSPKRLRKIENFCKKSKLKKSLLYNFLSKQIDLYMKIISIFWNYFREKWIWGRVHLIIKLKFWKLQILEKVKFCHFWSKQIVLFIKKIFIFWNYFRQKWTWSSDFLKLISKFPKFWFSQWCCQFFKNF